MIYERIKQLCDIKGISVSELERRIGVSRGSICKIDRHKPSSKTLEKIAEELNSNFDYVYSGKGNPFSDDEIKIEQEIIEIYQKLNQEQKDHVLNMMRLLNNNNNK